MKHGTSYLDREADVDEGNRKHDVYRNGRINDLQIACPDIPIVRDAVRKEVVEDLRGEDWGDVDLRFV